MFVNNFLAPIQVRKGRWGLMPCAERPSSSLETFPRIFLISSESTKGRRTVWRQLPFGRLV